MAGWCQLWGVMLVFLTCTAADGDIIKSKEKNDGVGPSSGITSSINNFGPPKDFHDVCETGSPSSLALGTSDLCADSPKSDGSAEKIHELGNDGRVSGKRGSIERGPAVPRVGEDGDRQSQGKRKLSRKRAAKLTKRAKKLGKEDPLAATDYLQRRVGGRYNIDPHAFQSM